LTNRHPSPFQNIHTIPTTSVAALGASFDLYHHLSPSIIGMQEPNKNWTCYDSTMGRLRQCTDRRWPGSKLVTAHCPDNSFNTPAQPGGVAQVVLRQLTARIVKHRTDPIGQFASQEILLEGTSSLLEQILRAIFLILYSRPIRQKKRLQRQHCVCLFHFKMNSNLTIKHSKIVAFV
jgi:hypothetical protein